MLMYLWCELQASRIWLGEIGAPMKEIKLLPGAHRDAHVSMV